MIEVTAFEVKTIFGINIISWQLNGFLSGFLHKPRPGAQFIFLSWSSILLPQRLLWTLLALMPSTKRPKQYHHFKQDHKLLF